MSDFEFDLEGDETPFDPVKNAQKAMRAVLPKRFYKIAQTIETIDGFSVQLDGRIAKTSGKRPLVLPTFPLAELVAAEFEAQKEFIDPFTMPVLRIVNPAIDSVSGLMSQVRADIASYAGTDMLCYRANEPEKLVDRQNAMWNPIVERVEIEIGARFVLAEGVMHVAQQPATLEAFAKRLELATPNAFTLSAAHVMTSLTGSAMLALSTVEVWLSPNEAWSAAHLDEDWTIEFWGEDLEAQARRAKRLIEFEAAAKVIAAMRHQ
ncbi:MAG: ATP12 family chaperone protein [Notoacmeibacter sp.]